MIILFDDPRITRKLDAEEALLNTCKKCMHTEDYDHFCFVLLDVIDDVQGCTNLLHEIERQKAPKPMIRAFKDYILELIDLEDFED